VAYDQLLDAVDDALLPYAAGIRAPDSPSTSRDAPNFGLIGHVTRRLVEDFLVNTIQGKRPRTVAPTDEFSDHDLDALAHEVGVLVVQLEPEALSQLATARRREVVATLERHHLSPATSSEIADRLVDEMLGTLRSSVKERQ
jgi:hypothetical protein